ncbi:aminotransferase class IV [Paenibacillus sp. NFR01]|uniref:aminotransferase class IV n=1 Tax=Paenibacillus sp. NFR01 TaxID=1566279 RepID=UPI0008BB11EF|nr:aminotransferase class IV [Paenibacillus sp. NFR01]SEU31273.1 4-amino-4-deoxychorismate lyase [Paenibacillus sp. NFR01]
MSYIGLNYKAVHAAEAVVPARDHGFLYGMGLFETFRTYGGVPFLLERHLRRMADGCRMLGIPFTPDPERLQAWISQLMEVNELTEAYIRYTVTAGEDVLGLPGDRYAHPNHLLYIKALPPFSPALYTEGKPLQLLQTRRNTPEGPVRLKSLHYMNNILAKRELAGYPAAARGAEGLMLTADGYLAEGIVSNVFFIKAGTLYTPDIRTGILSGITREMVLELAGASGLMTEQGFYSWEELKTADEIFVTSSIQEIVPVTALCDEESEYIISEGRCGQHTSNLIALYRGRTGIPQ